MDPDRERFYETCQRLGIGISVMKAYGGGDLLSEQSPADKALTVNQCLHYVFNLRNLMIRYQREIGKKNEWICEAA